MFEQELPALEYLQKGERSCNYDIDFGALFLLNSFELLCLQIIGRLIGNGGVFGELVNDFCDLCC